MTFRSRPKLVIPTLLTNPVLRENVVKSKNCLKRYAEALKNIICPALMLPPDINLPKYSTSNDPLTTEQSSSYSTDPSTLKKCLMDEIQPQQPGKQKVTIVGCGCVGIACAVCILQQQVTHDLVIVDHRKDKVLGEVTDLQHGSTFLQNLHLRATQDFEATAGSAVCVITSGARQKGGESRISLLSRNANIIKAIIPPLVKHSPDAVCIVVTNPVDIITNLAWKLSGLPQGRVFGSGCEVDTSRFRVFIGEKLGLAPASCHGWIIGEHGDSSVPVWSSVNVAGVRFMDINPRIGTPDDPENWSELHKKVVNSAAEVLKLKGHTAWAIGMTCSVLTHAVLNNLGTVHSLSVLSKGYHDIDDDVFLSLPASVGINGVNNIFKQNLTETERKKLQKSAQALKSAQCRIEL